LNARGVSVAVAGYDFCPQVAIADIIDEMRGACLWLWRRKRRRLTVVGHSAGGHLAVCMLAQDWPAFAADTPADLVPAAYAISGVYDLAPVLKISVNADLRLDAGEARRVSPLTWRYPRGRTLDAVVGARESSEFLRQSRAIVDAWQGTAQTRYEEIAGADHFTIVDHLSDAKSDMCARISDLAFAANAIG
jgi:arylformamidase